MSLQNDLYERNLTDIHYERNEMAFWNNKGIRPKLLDQEAGIEQREERLREAREKYRRWRSWLRYSGKATDADRAKFAAFTNKCIKDGTDLEDFKAFVDSQFVKHVESVDGPTEAEVVETYLQSYIDKMSLGELAVAIDCLEQMRRNGTLPWIVYLDCGLAVTHRLVKGAPDGGWQVVRARLWKHKLVHHGSTKHPTSEDRLSASLHVSIEDAIDKIRYIRRMAAVNKVSIPKMIELLEEKDKKAEYGTSLWEAMVTKAHWG